MPRLLLLFLLLPILVCLVHSQDEEGPRQPILLKNADSLLGNQVNATSVREFMGNVRFVQGNVVVTCNRALHFVDANRVELYGNVIVTQGSLRMRAPAMTYDGATNIAVASGGVEVVDSNRVVTSRTATYSTRTHRVTFQDSVHVHDDSLRLACDTLHYERDTQLGTALHNVVIRDSANTMVMMSDTGYHDKRRKYLRMTGSSRLWQWDTTGSASDPTSPRDTLFITADTMEAFQAESKRYLAHGNAALVRVGLAARAASMDYREQEGTIDLRTQPVVWNDSTMLKADSVQVDIPGRILKHIAGVANAMLVSRSDTVYTDRFDQISGDRIDLTIEQDTMRRLLSTGSAKSLTFRYEEAGPQGLTRFTADTIKAEFKDGKPEDVYWLGGVHGEQHPERLVSGRSAEQRLPGFVWREDRPRLLPPPRQ